MVDKYPTVSRRVSAEYRLTTVEKSTSQCVLMDLDHFLDRASRYCAARGISESRLGTLLFNDGNKFAALRAGRDVGVRRLERAAEELARLEAEVRATSSASPASPDPAAQITRNSEEVFR
jgi:hypothetical protein